MRRYPGNQSGATLMGALMAAVLIGFFAYIGVKLVPVYMENFGVNSALKSLAEEQTQGLAPGEIRSRLMKRLQVNNVESVRPEHIRVQPMGGAQVLSVDYEVRTRFYGHLYLLLVFNESVVLTGRN